MSSHPFFIWYSRSVSGTIFYHFKSLKTGKTLTVDSKVLAGVGEVKMGRVSIEETFLRELLSAKKNAEKLDVLNPNKV